MSKEAMKLALEALAVKFSEGWHEGIKIDASDIMLLNDAAQALAEQPAPPECQTEAEKTAYAFGWWKALESQRALDKKAENARELGLDYEPIQCPICKAEDSPYPKCGCVTYVEQPAQQEPVAYLCENAVGHKYFRWKRPSSTYKPIALYTSPPAQRTWVELTDEERKLVRTSVGYNQFVTASEYAEHVQKATEFKLREKNT